MPKRIAVVAAHVMLACVWSSDFAQAQSRTENLGTPHRTHSRAKRKGVTVKKSQPLSPLFARQAFSLQQYIDNMSTASLEPLLDDNAESDLFTIQQKALEREMARIREFDLVTIGDEALFYMIETAAFLLYSHKIALYLKTPDEFEHRWIYCLSDIQQAITQRAYSNDGRCNTQTAANTSDESPSEGRSIQRNSNDSN